MERAPAARQSASMASAPPARRGSDLRLAVSVGAAIVLWASAFPGIRAGLEAYGPGELALFRSLVASGAFALHVALRRPRLPAAAEWPRIAALGIAGIAGYNLALNLGERTVGAGAASFLVATVPLFTALLASVLLREAFHWRLLVGLLVGLLGVGLISLGEGGGLPADAGALFVLGAAVHQALFFVLQKRSLARSAPLAVVAAATWVGTLLLLPFLPGLVLQLTGAPASATVAVAYLGLLPGTVAYLAWASVLARLPASAATPFLYLVPFVATLIAWGWLGETPGPRVVAGGLVVIAAVALSRWRHGRPRPSRRAEGPSVNRAASPPRPPVDV